MDFPLVYSGFVNEQRLEAGQAVVGVAECLVPTLLGLENDWQSAPILQ